MRARLSTRLCRWRQRCEVWSTAVIAVCSCGQALARTARSDVAHGAERVRPSCHGAWPRGACSCGGACSLATANGKWSHARAALIVAMDPLVQIFLEVDVIRFSKNSFFRKLFFPDISWVLLWVLFPWVHGYFYGCMGASLHDYSPTLLLLGQENHAIFLGFEGVP